MNGGSTIRYEYSDRLPQGLKASNRRIGILGRRGVISSITWMELMAGARTRDDETYLADDHIMKHAASIRRGSIELGRKVALPDAIIMATGQLHSDVVITRNKKDFRMLRNLGKLRIPYELTNTDPVGFINAVPPSLTRSYEPTREK